MLKVKLLPLSTEIEISPFGNNLIFKKDFSKEFIHATILENKLNGLKINTRWENIDRLDFLYDFDFLKSLDITGNNDYDFSFLSSLKDLKYLSISLYGKNDIDLSNQQNLENLVIQWRKGKIKGLEKCHNITSLCLVDFKEDDFLPIVSLKNLKDLKIKTSSIKTINGIQDFPLLESLLLGNCKLLKSLNHIEVSKYIHSLNIELCTQIEDYKPIGKLSSLESLQITDCKGINTIQFVQNLPALKKIMLLGNTDVLDGNMMPAKNITEVIYNHRKHYNIKIENEEHKRLIKSNLEKIKSMFK